MRAQKIRSEWSFTVLSEDVGKDPSHHSIEANEDERKAVARRLGVTAIKELRAELDVVRDNGRVIHVYGTVYSILEQECVVSMEMIDVSIEEEFEGWFAGNDDTVSFARAKRDRMMPKTGTELPILDEEEDPEPLVDGIIDVAELVVQSLSLSIPEYPHKDGIVYENEDSGNSNGAGSDLRKNPFAALKDWKEKREG